MDLVHGTSQARILERVIIFFSRGSFQPRDRIRVSCISYVWQADSLPTELSGKPKYMSCKIGIINSLRGMREWIKNPLFYWLKNRARVVNKKKTPWYLIGQGQSRTVTSKKLKKKKWVDGNYEAMGGLQDPNYTNPFTNNKNVFGDIIGEGVNS